MLAARTARTAARPAVQTLLRRQQPQHNFSIVHNLRSFARSFEPHPFQRLPIKSDPAPADWARLVRRSVGQVAVFVPVGFALLGWPYVAAKVLDGSV